MKAIGMALVGMALLIVGCGDEIFFEDELTTARIELTDGEEAGFLMFMNDPMTTLERLDYDCAIRSDSARQIVRYRDGHDKTAGTADDNLFDSVEEVDAVNMVGPWTVDQLFACAESYGYIAQEPAACGDLSLLQEDWEGLWEFTELWRYEDLDPEMAARVDALLPDAQQYANQEIIFPVEFGALTTFWDNGQPVAYHLEFVQWLDPECGVQLWIRYYLDACGEVLDVWVFV